MLTYMHADITILPYIIVGMVNNSAVTMEQHCWGGLAIWLGPHRWCHTAALYSITVRTCISCQALTLIKSLSLSLCQICFTNICSSSKVTHSRLTH